MSRQESKLETSNQDCPRWGSQRETIWSICYGTGSGSHRQRSHKGCFCRTSLLKSSPQEQWRISSRVRRWPRWCRRSCWWPSLSGGWRSLPADGPVSSFFQTSRICTRFRFPKLTPSKRRHIWYIFILIFSEVPWLCWTMLLISRMVVCHRMVS